MSQFPTRSLLALTLTLMFAAPASAQLGLGVSVGSGSGGGVSVGVDSGGGSLGLDVDVGVGAGGSGGDLLDRSPVTLGQEGALEAVRSRRALPLEEVLLRARLVAQGDIIDAQLIAASGILLYELKVLSQGGDVSKLYFYARSGLPVRVK